MMDQPEGIQESGPRLSIDEKRLELSSSDRSVTLTRKEFDILMELYSDPGRVFSRQELLTQVWGDEIFVDLRTVDAHVVKLRRKIKGLGGNVPTIETVWGLGYRLEN